MSTKLILEAIMSSLSIQCAACGKHDNSLKAKESEAIGLKPVLLNASRQDKGKNKNSMCPSIHFPQRWFLSNYVGLII